MKKRIIEYLKTLYKVICRPELRVLPGQVAYFLVLSLIPLISVIAVIASKLSVSIDEIVNILSGTLPKQIIDLLLPAFETPSFGVGVSMAVGFFLASNATSSFIVASNMLYKIDNDSYILRRIKALIMLVVFIFLLLFVLVVMAYGTTIITFVYDLLFKTDPPVFLTTLFLISKWTIGIFIMFFMIKIIYTMAPNEAIPSSTMTKGAIFTTVAWIVATFCFSIYVTNFSNYNLFYSSLANIVILMIWVYILSYSFVIGIAINTDDHHRITDKQKGKKKV